jgi:uncharacterized MAPEG superfamily protein
MDTLKTSNLSILAIPTYFILAFAPHVYALNIATSGKARDWRHCNPRSATLKTQLKETLSDSDFELFERSEASSANLYENLPLFASAVIVGNMAGLKKEGWGGLNAFAGMYLGVRAIYALVYIGTSKNKFSPLRTWLWAASWVLCFRIFGQAAKRLGGKGI